MCGVVSKNIRGIINLLRKLPESYQNFYIQWKLTDRRCEIRHMPRVDWVRNPEPGKISQTKPIAIRRKFTRPDPVYYLPTRAKGDSEPKEIKREYPFKPYLETISKEYGLWGGEGIIKSFVKKNLLRRCVPPFLSPALNKTVVYSEILDKHIEIKVSRNTSFLIDHVYGFDGYILETNPQDLKSIFGVKLKRELLLALVKKDFLPNNLAKREELYEMFNSYSIPVEEAEWYGLTPREAIEKFQLMQRTRLENLKPNYMNDKKKPVNDSSKNSSSSTSLVFKLKPFRSNKSV